LNGLAARLEKLSSRRKVLILFSEGIDVRVSRSGLRVTARKGYLVPR
jgi:hypothetical protein